MKTLNRLAILIFLPILGIAGYYLADIFLVDDEKLLMNVSAECNPFSAPCTFTDEGLQIRMGFEAFNQSKSSFRFKLVSQKPLKEVTIGFQNSSISEGQSKPFPVKGSPDGLTWQLMVDLAENVREVEDWTLVMVITEGQNIHFAELPFFIKHSS